MKTSGASMVLKHHFPSKAHVFQKNVFQE